jgi:uncharacterized LabA/DUF88 family protein
MAVHFLNDAWLDRYDCGIIVSNDSDLAQAMSLVKHQHKKVLGLITPSKGKTSKELRIHADFVRHIRPGALQTSQLPDPIPGTSLCKPSRW